MSRVMTVLVVIVASLVATVCGKFASRAEEEAFVQSKINFLTKNTPHQLIKDDTVYIYLDLFQLVDVDEKQGLVNAKFWFYLYYYIEELGWDSNVTNVTVLHLPAGTFWVPDVVALQVTQEISGYEFKGQIILSYGIVAPQSSLKNWKFSCGFNVEYFPFDTQTCHLTFVIWTGDEELPPYLLGVEKSILRDNVSMLLDSFEENDQWEVTSATLVTAGEAILVTLSIRRRHLYFFNVIVMPTIILALVSILTFLLPVESGEKVSLGVTILLSQIVSLLVLNDILPSSSLSFPLLGTFAMRTIILISVSVLLAIIVINVHHMDGSVRVPRWVRRLFRSRMVCLAGVTPVRSIKVTLQPPAPSSSVEQEKTAGAESDDSQAAHDGEVTWPKVAVLVDRVAMLLYSVVMIVTVVRFLVDIMGERP